KAGRRSRDAGAGWNRAEVVLHSTPVVVGSTVPDTQIGQRPELADVGCHVAVEVVILAIRLDGDSRIQLDREPACGVMKPCGVKRQIEDQFSPALGDVEGGGLALIAQGP